MTWLKLAPVLKRSAQFELENLKRWHDIAITLFSIILNHKR